MLHPNVLFIGDRPNPKKNLSMDVPFVGTKSYKTLLEWIYRMDVDINRVYILNAYDAQGKKSEGLKALLCASVLAQGWRSSPHYRVVCFGQSAADFVAEHNIKFSTKIEIFKLPHPSGLNRELNDKKKLSEQLARCRAWIYKENL